MHRYNFPACKNVRRESALERLKQQKAKDEDHTKFIKKAIEALEVKIAQNIR